MENKAAENLKTLDRINKERIFWMRISIFVVISVLLIIFSWDKIFSLNLVLFIVSCGLIISVIWWYWTMKSIRILLTMVFKNVQVIEDLQVKLKSLRNDIKN